eukprot:Em0001g2838a
MDASKVSASVGSDFADGLTCGPPGTPVATTMEESFTIVLEGSIQGSSAALASALSPHSSLDSSFAAARTENRSCSSSFVEITNLTHAETSGTEGEDDSSFVVVKDNSSVMHQPDDTTDNMKSKASHSSGVVHLQNTTDDPVDDASANIDPSVKPLARESGGSPSTAGDIPSSNTIRLLKAEDGSPTDPAHTADGAYESENGGDPYSTEASSKDHTSLQVCAAIGADALWTNDKGPLNEAGISPNQVEHVTGSNAGHETQSVQQSTDDIYHVDGARELSEPTAVPICDKADGIPSKTNNKVSTTDPGSEGSTDAEDLETKIINEPSKIEVVTMSKTNGGIPGTEGVNSKREENPSVTTYATTATDSKLSADLQNSVTGDEYAKSKSGKALSDTDGGGVPMVTEGSETTGNATPGTNCQPTPQVAAIAPTGEHSGSDATSDAKGSSPASKTGDVASKMDDTQLKTDNEPSQSDGALPVKDDVHSAREDDKLLLKENDSPSTCMTTNGTGGGTPMTGGVHSTTERMPSVTTCGTTAADPKPSSDMQKSVPGDECATPKSKNAMPNTDDGCVPATTVADKHLGSAAATGKGSSAASKCPDKNLSLFSQQRLTQTIGCTTAGVRTPVITIPLLEHPLSAWHPPPPSTPVDGCVQVTFHVIVPQDQWGDPSSTDPMCEMTCSLSMDPEVLKDPLPYKYVVFSPKVMKQKAGHPYEYLYGHSKSHGHNNRCIVVPGPELRIGGSYVQYDTIAYPCEEVVSAASSKASKGGSRGAADRRDFFSRASNIVKATVGRVWSYATGSTEGSFALPHKEERLYSLCVYLQPYADALCRGDYTDSLVKMAEKMAHVYSLMSKVQICNNKGMKTEPVNVSQEMAQFFSTVVDKLVSKSAETQLCASVAVIYCSYELLRMELPSKSVALGLNMLRPSPHQENKSCLEITLLHSLIPEDKRHVVGYAIWQLCSQQWRNTKEPLCTEWLHALPLAHLLCGSCTPFGEMPRPKDLQWVDETLQQRGVSGRNEILNAFEQYQKLQDLFQLDPLLLPVFVHVCPRKELTTLFKFIPSYVSTAYISYMVSIEEWATARVNKFISLLSVVMKAKETQVKTRQPQTFITLHIGNKDSKISPHASHDETTGIAFFSMYSILGQAIKESCSMLIEEINKKIQTTRKGHSVELIKALIPLVLSARSTHNDPSEMNERLSDGALYRQLALLMEAWITSTDLIGHPSFGGNEDTLISSWKGMDELKLWQEILKIEIDCSGTILERWHFVVCEQVKKRIYQLKEKAKLKLVCYVEELPDIHTLLVNAIFEIGAGAIDAICVQGLFLGEVPKEWLQEQGLYIFSLSHEGMFAKACRILVSSGLAPNNEDTWKLIREKHPEGPLPIIPETTSAQSISLNDDFDVYNILKSFPKGTAAGPSGLRVQHLLDAASIPLPTTIGSLLRRVVNLLVSGKVSQEVSLFMAGGSLTALSKVKPGCAPDIRPIAVGEVLRRLTGKCLCAVLKQRVIDFFEPIQFGVACPMGSEKGGKQALYHIEELAQKESIRIGKLIGRILIKEYPSVCNTTCEVSFDDLIQWDCWPCFIRISNGTSKVKDGLNEHCIAVCRAAVNRLNHVCTQLSSGEIVVKELLRLKEKEQHLLVLCVAAKVVSTTSVLGILKQRMHELECLNELNTELGKDIGNLSIGALCTSSSAGTVNVIVIVPAAGPLNHIAQMFFNMTAEYPSSTFNGFWESHLQNEIRIHSSACLTFDHIENVMKNESLNKITDTLVSTGKFLRDIASDNQKRKCIEMFQKCVQFREWLRKVTKDVNGLNRFVTIALSTATGGEDALTQEKLYNLRVVGSGYGPLIYSLSRDAGFRELSNHCMAVWKVLQTNPELPTILDGCMAHLDWYKHIKQNIGSVEQSSFKQLEHIRSNGQYSVIAATKRSFSRLQIKDVVFLNILPEEEYAIKRQYTLDELRDLESRLILITSKEAENRNHVDRFIHTLHSICCIAEVLVELQRAGNVTYNGWNLTCLCKTVCVEDLKDIAKQMEVDLQSWKKELMSMRDAYYELNYYTNAQLLAIRKEMAKLQFSFSVLLLLQSISPKVTVPILQMAIRCCLEHTDRRCDDITEAVSVKQDLACSVQELSLTMKSGLSIRMAPEDSHYLTLQQVGQILQILKSTLQDNVENQRPLPSTLAYGKPNLISTDSSNVLKAVLSIYMEDPSSPLPTLEEVLLCDQHTTEEEALLLFKRAVKDPGFKRIYCLAHAEKLSYRVADNVLRLLDEITQGHLDYRLAIVCGIDEEGVSHVTAKLQLFQRSFRPRDDNACAQYMQSKLVYVPPSKLLHRRRASVKSRYSALVVTSTRAGMGKSLYVQRMAENTGGSHIVHVPVHGPVVTADSIIDLLEHNKHTACSIFHFDVAPTVLHKANAILFSLLVLKGLTDILGNMWRCNEKDIFVVEVTVPEQEDNAVATSALSFLNLLPRIKCVSPLQLREANGVLPDVVGCDRVTFKHEHYILVYNYLRETRGRQITAEINVHQDQLQVYMQHCGLRDPSWSELGHFVNFLAAQLDACTNSIFCDENMVGDTLRGMKDFVVKFMIRMSRDFATPSLQGELTHEGLTQHQCMADQHSIAMYQINEQKKWEKSSHPYLFFNQDRVTITFVGFIVSPQGDLVDPRRRGPQLSTSQQGPSVQPHSINTSELMPGSVGVGASQGFVEQRFHGLQHGTSLQHSYVPQRSINATMQAMLGSSFPSGYPLARGTSTRGNIASQGGWQSASTNTPIIGQSIIERSIMSPQLFSGLVLNGVNFNEDYSCWKKVDMIKKLAIVMGLNMEVTDPDASYALTVDNVLKILAMQMRFRCDIPVILMGESGCGKTRLVQYMCNLAAQSTETTNLKILKVHGGTTEDDIVLCVREAEKLAMDNSERGLDTVVFFDEANTTEAIGLIKEIMCDGRMKGSPISTNIKFIAACNPYRRHSDDMIEKLESAGLGFYVKCSETQERLGKTPLRHLVYRVLELPPSMRSLVYDFGQLDTHTEAEYVIQIVKNRLSNDFDPSTITAISHVLSWSQQYMKDQKVFYM